MNWRDYTPPWWKANSRTQRALPGRGLAFDENEIASRITHRYLLVVKCQTFLAESRLPARSFAPPATTYKVVAGGRLLFGFSLAFLAAG
jgi:hypothetical protein